MKILWGTLSCNNILLHMQVGNKCKQIFNTGYSAHKLENASEIMVKSCICIAS